MKKTLCILFLVLAICLMTVSVTGCVKTEIKEPSSVSDEKDETVDPTETIDEEPESLDEEPESLDEEPEHLDEVIEENVLLDDAGIKITAKKLSRDKYHGPTLKLLVENNTDQNLTFQARNTSVNGYMVDEIFSCNVVAGKKANDELIFSESDLTLCGITTIADIELSFHVFDSESWDTYYDSDMISLETSAKKDYDYSFDESGCEVYDSNGIKIVFRGLTEGSSIFGPSIIMYAFNNTDQDICIQVGDFSINGFMVNPLFSCSLIPQKHIIDSITIMQSELEENDIETIDEVELSFHIIDNSTWDTIVDTDPITVYFE